MEINFSIQARSLANLSFKIYSVFLLHSLSAMATTTAGTVSIAYNTGYIALRECVQSALWSGRNVAGEWNVVDWLGCTNHLDICFCRADLASSASSLLTSGINSFCSSDIADVSSGIAVYNNYCSRAAPATALTAVTTSESDSSTTTMTAMQTLYTSSASNTSPRELLSILISALLALHAAISPFMRWWYYWHSENSLSTANYGAGPVSSRSPSSPNSTSNPAPGTSTSVSEATSRSDQINLGIGLGVGLGIGLITCSLSIVLIVMKCRKRRR